MQQIVYDLPDDVVSDRILNPLDWFSWRYTFMNAIGIAILFNNIFSRYVVLSLAVSGTLLMFIWNLKFERRVDKPNYKYKKKTRVKKTI